MHYDMPGASTMMATTFKVQMILLFVVSKLLNFSICSDDIQSFSKIQYYTCDILHKFRWKHVVIVAGECRWCCFCWLPWRRLHSRTRTLVSLSHTHMYGVRIANPKYTWGERKKNEERGWAGWLTPGVRWGGATIFPCQHVIECVDRISFSSNYRSDSFGNLFAWRLPAWHIMLRIYLWFIHSCSTGNEKSFSDLRT